MSNYQIQDDDHFQEVLLYVKEDGPFNTLKLDQNILTVDQYKFELDKQYISQIEQVISKPQKLSEYSDDLIFGKDKTEGVVSVEIINNKVRMYLLDGSYAEKDNYYWMLASKPLDRKFKPLAGDLHYKYIRLFRNRKEFKKYSGKYYTKDIYTVWNEAEAAMIFYGITQFKGLKVEDVPILSWDIEGAGLTRNDDSEVFMISNTFRGSNGKIERKTFRLDHYTSSKEMMEDWSVWVCAKDPTIMNGHNVYGYDLDYMNHVIGLQGGELLLGRDGSALEQKTKMSRYRVDGSQTWEYKKAKIHGRHIIDGMFLAVKHDIGRNYPSWGLKAIAEYEGLVKEDRQFYDASKIAENWADPIEREKIVKYGEDDSDDSLALYDLMIPSFFYMAQSIPKPFQVMMNGATGSWINSILVRSYLQDHKSIPKPSEADTVNGGMSYGIPGVYSNVSKWDAASYYPSTILTFDIYDRQKDPEAHFLKMVKYFTAKRFEQKGLYKETGDKYYNDLQASSKVFINSAYGVLGTNGLNFNSFKNAALITRCCRAGLQKAIYWATGKDIHYWWEEYKDSKTCSDDFNKFDFIDQKAKTKYEDIKPHNWKLVNLDTDSLSFAKEDGSEFTQEEYDMIYKEINDIMYSAWEDDGQFESVAVLKAKNYILKDKNGKIKTKGSSLRDQKKEPALLEMLDKMIKVLVDNE